MLTFNKQQTVRIFSAAIERNKTLLLVKDQGVYLMIGAKDPKDNVVEYAKGYNPDVDKDWYEKACHEFGGDDFGWNFNLPKQYMQTLIDKQHDWKKVQITYNARQGSFKVKAV